MSSVTRMSSAWIRTVAIALSVASVSLVSMATWSPAAAEAACTDPFTPDLHAAIAEQHPDQRVTAAVHDTRTGCWNHLAPGTQMQTASVIKAQFLAGVLLRAQDQGRSTTTWEQERITPMISLSHDPPATDLFISLGGTKGQEALDERFGLTSTTSTNQWGATLSTATDRTELALALLHGGGPLAAGARAQAWEAMAAVHATQQWGITAGVPDGWTVAVKNGFYPTSGTPGWRVGSTGFVRHDATGEGYAITVMTDQNPDHLAGQRLVELVAREVARTLTGGEPAPRAVDRSICVATHSGETWASVADRIGSRPSAVRSVSGGPASPLEGMRACRPDLAAGFDPDGSTARYVRATSRTFLGRDPAPTELAQHAVAIDAAAMTSAEHTRSLSQSLEWIGLTIDDLYRRALGRTADDAGRRYWRDLVVGGMRITDVGALFYGSDEFHASNGGTDEGFVDGLYRELLHRAPEAAGAAHWQDQLRSGISRVAVAASFYASPESRRDRVTTLYEAVLERAPDSDGLRYWVDALLRLDDVALAAFLAASEEYFHGAQR